MRTKPSQYLEDRRIVQGAMRSTRFDGNNGQFIVYRKKSPLLIQASDQGGWEHVSVSRRGSSQPPSWADMCFVKDLFWSPDECVVQYHPPESDYVNNHPGCLHLWRPIGQFIPMPPKVYV